MVANRVDHFASAVHEIDDARRQAALCEQLENPLLRKRNLFGRLEHECVAARDRKRQKPQRHHRWKIERRDDGADTDRLSHHLAIDTGRDVFETVPHQHRRRAAGDLDAFDAAADAAARFVERLAVFGRDKPRKLVQM